MKTTRAQTNISSLATAGLLLLPLLILATGPFSQADAQSSPTTSKRAAPASTNAQAQASLAASKKAATLAATAQLAAQTDAANSAQATVGSASGTYTAAVATAVTQAGAAPTIATDAIAALKNHLPMAYGKDRITAIQANIALLDSHASVLGDDYQNQKIALQSQIIAILQEIDNNTSTQPQAAKLQKDMNILYGTTSIPAAALSATSATTPAAAATTAPRVLTDVELSPAFIQSVLAEEK